MSTILASSSPRCAVCAQSDRRALVDVKLDDGEMLVLCGTHAVMMRRLSPKASDVAELRRRLCDRRDATERRLEDDAGDALATALHAAFAGERRRGADRRALPRPS